MSACAQPRSFWSEQDLSNKPSFQSRRLADVEAEPSEPTVAERHERLDQEPPNSTCWMLGQKTKGFPKLSGLVSSNLNLKVPLLHLIGACSMTAFALIVVVVLLGLVVVTAVVVAAHFVVVAVVAAAFAVGLAGGARSLAAGCFHVDVRAAAILAVAAEGRAAD